MTSRLNNRFSSFFTRRLLLVRGNPDSEAAEANKVRVQEILLCTPARDHHTVASCNATSCRIAAVTQSPAKEKRHADALFFMRVSLANFTKPARSLQSPPRQLLSIFLPAPPLIVRKQLSHSAASCMGILELSSFLPPLSICPRRKDNSRGTIEPLQRPRHSCPRNINRGASRGTSYSRDETMVVFIVRADLLYFPPRRAADK